MDIRGDIPLKVYLYREDSGENEIRRFSVEFPYNDSFAFLKEKIKDVFPGISGKVFTIYWKDEEDDEVTISSNAELILAIKSMNDEVKKLFVKVKAPEMGSKENEYVHFGIICDGCDRNVSGIRHKCTVCYNYDLCSNCQESGIHDEHPMLRIPPPLFGDQATPFVINIGKYKSRKHSECGQKKRKCDKRDAGQETGDESEELHHGKFHKKCKKSYKCGYKKEERGCGKAERKDDNFRICHTGPYSQMVNDIFLKSTPFQPRQTESQNPTNNENATKVPSLITYLKYMGSSLQKVLDPLGVSVEFEIRNKEEKKNENREEKKNERREEKKNEKKEEKKTSTSTSTTPPQVEVRFETKEQIPNMMQKIEEITKMLSNQTVSNGADVDNGWVSFEELKKDLEEPQSSSSSKGEAAKPSQTQPTASEEKNEGETNGKQNLYPNLTPRVPSAVTIALEKMLSMGFTNEGNWLTSLLEATNGDINQALETLSLQKKNIQ